MKYIEDKEMYKAVQFARRLLREGNSFTKAVQISSNYYKKDYSTICSYLSSLSNKNKGKKFAYKYYIIATYNCVDDEDSGHNSLCKIEIAKAKTKYNAECKYEYNQPVSRYRTIYYISRVYKEIEFSKKEKAEEYLKNNYEEIKKYFKAYEY